MPVEWASQQRSAPGDVWAWGANGYGQLGDGTNRQHVEPAQVGLERVKAISAGGWHSVALLQDGTVWAWGANGWGQLGNGAYVATNQPTRVPEVEEAVAVSAGGGHTLALLGDGTVRAWGLQDWYQLGNPTWQNSPKPKDVLQLAGVRVDRRDGGSRASPIAAGAWHSLALLADGTVRGWGANNYGQLGNGTTSTNTYRPPVQALQLESMTAVAVGSHHSLALREDGTVWAWGANAFGQLGDGTNQHRNRPVQVTPLEHIRAIAAGNPDNSHHSLALSEDGTVWAWGANGYGQLGDGTNQHRNRPVQVLGIQAKMIAAGGWHNAAYGWPLTAAAHGSQHPSEPEHQPK
ncbi:MAG: RCC1 repeat-containing protein, partial [Actinobacteria bacterium]|nr:RCC1 repeat-containing protein [Actinomycetota bacterium]